MRLLRILMASIFWQALVTGYPARVLAGLLAGWVGG